jgi:DNA-binding GntR family transcriptional regulator
MTMANQEMSSGPPTLDGVVRLNRPAPLRQRVQEQLRELIVARALAPGDHLVEGELAERLGVSRGPVREALQALHREGWVDLHSGRGAFVHKPSDSEVDEIFAVRAALESEAAALAAARIGGTEMQHLRDLCARGKNAVNDGDDSAAVAANSQFHASIAQYSGVRLLAEYIETLDLRVRWLYKPLVAVRKMDSWTEHDEIVEALAANDTNNAATLMRAHSERTRAAYRDQQQH